MVVAHPRSGVSNCEDCIVRSTTICGAADAEAAQELGALSRAVSAGADLLAQGACSGNIYVIHRGWACLYELLEDGRRQILRFLLPGDMIGMYGEDGGASFGAQALTPLIACVVPRERFLRLARERPGLALRMGQLMAQQEALAYEHLTSLGRRTARERVAHLLLELFYRARTRIAPEPGDQITLPLTQAHLADALGLTPVHINRMLRALRAEGVIELTQRRLKVCDPDKLATAAGFEREVNFPGVGARRPLGNDGVAQFGTG